MRFEKSDFKNGNQTLKCFLCCPQCEDCQGSDGKKKYPVAIFIGEKSKGSSLSKKYAKDFAKMGFAAVVYDFSISEDEKNTQDNLEKAILNEKENLKAIIQSVCELPFADKNNITLTGFGFGGFAAALAAEELQQKIKYLILFYPAFASCEDSAFDRIKKYKGSVLIIHGSNDTVVNPDSSKKLCNAYLFERGNIPVKDVQLVFVDGAPHGFIGEDKNLWNRYALFAITKVLQGKTLFFNVDVNLTHADNENLNDGGVRVKVYFKGHSESLYFSGDVETPVYDEQIYHSPVPDSCCAEYRILGKDYTGKDCWVKIKNYLSKPARAKKVDWYTDWKPTVSTDSEALAQVNKADCETYAEMRSTGPFIHIWG